MENTSLARAVDLVLVEDSEIEDPTQDLTVAEFAAKYCLDLPVAEAQSSRLERIYHFLFSPYYPKPLAANLRPYLKGVRQRIIESHQYDKIHYHNTIYQGCARLVGKCIVHMKNNLAS